MKYKKSPFIPVIVSAVFLFSVVFAMKYTYENLTDVLFLDRTDTTDDPNLQIFLPQDLGGMFNERGFMKSNSFSYDEQEIVNDFNGNLMYQVPISQGKGQGDLSYDLRLIYNGNVSYAVTTSSLDAAHWTSGQLHKYNLSAPGWILSLNGLAVQMLNFESSYFTNSSNGNESRGKNVRLLASGYQITDRPTTPSPPNDPDKITIMMGDGSTEILENKGGAGSSPYTGWYESKNRNNYMKAFVYHASTPPPLGEAGTDRIMFLMKGDGLTYIYKEYGIKFQDHEKELNIGMPSWFWPQVFLQMFLLITTPLLTTPKARLLPLHTEHCSLTAGVSSSIATMPVAGS